MEIILKDTDKNYVKFWKLDVGQCFESYGGFYLRIKEESYGNTLNLQSFDLASFDSDTEVRIMSSELTLSYI